MTRIYEKFALFYMSVCLFYIMILYWFMRESTILIAPPPYNRYSLCINRGGNAVSVVLLIAQGWQAKAQSTLGRLPWVATTL